MDKPLTAQGLTSPKWFWIEPDATHVCSLSGGILFRLPVAKPHLIILDEPTNYLDRDGLVLTQAIHEFKGGGHYFPQP